MDQKTRIKILEKELHDLRSHLEKVKATKSWKMLSIMQSARGLISLKSNTTPKKNAPGSIHKHFEAKNPVLRHLLKPPQPLDHKVSVVIPTYNAGHEFLFLIKKLRQQQGIGEIEIIIVDSGSTDDTISIGRMWADKVIEINQSEFTHSHARNIGAEAATNEYLLFMVQDAFPIGDYWIHQLLASHSELNVAALSAVEFCRIDSDWAHSVGVLNHYTFLNSLNNDRVGKLESSNHISLRQNGHLSNVTCLIKKEVFDKYRFRGWYGEDLNLAIALLKDGHQNGMSGLCKVIHSHNRNPNYHLKRGLVDVIYLNEEFEDFMDRPPYSVVGILHAIIDMFNGLKVFISLASQMNSVNMEEFREWLTKLMSLNYKAAMFQAIDLDPDIDKFYKMIFDIYDHQPMTQSQKLDYENYSKLGYDRVINFLDYVSHWYSLMDRWMISEVNSSLVKVVAANAGIMLASCLFADDIGEYPEIIELHDALKGGV